MNSSNGTRLKVSGFRCAWFPVSVRRARAVEYVPNVLEFVAKIFVQVKTLIGSCLSRLS
jgi:hypothetical protein